MITYRYPSHIFGETVISFSIQQCAPDHDQSKSEVQQNTTDDIFKDDPFSTHDLEDAAKILAQDF